MAPRKTKKSSSPADASKWVKALDTSITWDKDNFEDLPVVIHWIRQVLALVIGVAWGIIPLNGAVGIVSFFAVNVAILFVYYNKFLDIDEDSYGRMSLISEGMMPSFGLFLLAWITTYTAVHAPAP